MKDFTTPDGVYLVQFEVTSMRMSHEVFSPRVTHLPSGQVVLDLWDTMWDGSASVDEAGRLVLSMREYPGDKPGHTLTFDRNGMCTRTDE